MDRQVVFGDLKGLVLSEVKQQGDEIHFTVNDGRKFRLLHIQDCCEYVNIEDVCGDLSDLVGTPILMAEEATSNEMPEGISIPPESFTWTFYKMATVKGYVTIRFYGESNGYYSESVDFLEG